MIKRQAPFVISTSSSDSSLKRTNARKRQGFSGQSLNECESSGLEKSAAIRPFATKKSRLAIEKILLVDSLATESCRLADRLATKLKSKRTTPMRTERHCVTWRVAPWQSLSAQDARELAVRAPIVFASKFTNKCHVPAAHSCRHIVGQQCRLDQQWYLGFTKRGINLSA